MTEASPPIADELPRPAELAGYPAIRELGAGAGGHVYEVSADGGAKLAVKVLGGAAPTDRQAEEQLARRVGAFALIDHPHLVRTYDLVPAGPNLCVVMEYVAGPNLRQVLAARRPSPEEVATWTTQLAQAVDHLHRLGIVHRDLKPSNVLVTADGSLKLGDVAVSDLLAGAPSVQGTPAYMAPELVRGDLVVDGRADIYSLATIAYEALCGLPPFPGLGAEESMAAQLRRQPPDPSRIIPGFPEAVSEVLLRGLAKAPGDRPATAGEFAEALSSALRGPGVSAPAVALVPVPGAGDPALRTRQAPLGGARPPAKALPRRIAALPVRTPMSRPLLLASIVLLILAVGILGYGGYAVVRHLTTPLRVEQVTFTASPTTATVSSCVKAATFTFKSTIRTNGAAGEIDYAWTEHGTTITGLTGVLKVPADKRRVTVSKTFPWDPGVPDTAPIVFRANRATSKPVSVTYSCPR